MSASASASVSIGPNGAGKTTFFNCLLGILTPDEGTITLEGKDLTRVPTHRRARLGIGRTFQRIELFAGMSPREHLLVADRSRSGKGGLLKDAIRRGGPTAAEQARADGDAAPARARCGGRPQGGVAQPRHRPAGRGRAGAHDRAPSARSSTNRHRASTGTRPSRSRSRCARCKRERGFAILLVEHDVDLVRSFVERLFVLDFGTVIAAGRTDEVFADSAVRRAYLGDTV